MYEKYILIPHDCDYERDWHQPETWHVSAELLHIIFQHGNMWLSWKTAWLMSKKKKSSTHHFISQKHYASNEWSMFRNSDGLNCTFHCITCTDKIPQEPSLSQGFVGTWKCLRIVVERSFQRLLLRISYIFKTTIADLWHFFFNQFSQPVPEKLVKK